MDSTLFAISMVVVIALAIISVGLALRAYRRIIMRDTDQYLMAEQDLFRKKVAELRKKADENVRTSRHVQQRTYELSERINYLASVRGVADTERGRPEDPLGDPGGSHDPSASEED